MISRVISCGKNWIKALLYPRPIVDVVYLPRFISHWMRYARQEKEQRMALLDSYPCLGDWCTQTPFVSHYFYQGAWLARGLAQTNRQLHIDVGSSVLTASVLSGWVKTVFIDYRPLRARLTGLHSVAGDILALPFRNNVLKSLSCLHVLEHIGLGRYGDPLDPQGSIKAAKELQRVLSPGGRLYLSLPIGRERVCFNAHRVHAPATVIGIFSDLKLVDFSYVDDDGVMLEHEEVSLKKDLEFGCGMFVFEKPVC
jgi:SAM-dependent methyltransferase